MMENETIIALMLFAGFLGVLWGVSLHFFKVEMRANSSQLDITPILMELKEMVPSVSEDKVLDGVRELIQDSIEDILGEMHVPTGMDHVLGAVSMFLQHKMASSPAAPALDLVREIIDEDGPPSQ